MKEFEHLWHEGQFHGYFRREKLSNGQVCALYFLKHNGKHCIEYSVVLAIGKKKHINALLFGEGESMFDKTTGKCGLEGLLWAKRQLLQFESFLSEGIRHVKGKHKPIRISIFGTDGRRRRLYARRLANIGYREERRHGSHCVSKEVLPPPPNAMQRFQERKYNR